MYKYNTDIRSSCRKDKENVTVMLIILHIQNPYYDIPFLSCGDEQERFIKKIKQEFILIYIIID